MSKQSNISRLCEALAPVGLLMVAVAALVPVFSGSLYSLAWGKGIYAAGALWLLLARLFSPYRGSDMRMRRLVRMQAWSALFFVAGAVFLFMPGTAPRDWLALTMAGAAVQIIASIMIGKRATQSTEDK